MAPQGENQEFDLFGSEIAEDNDQTHLPNVPVVESPEQQRTPQDISDEQEGKVSGQPPKPESQNPPWVDPNKPDLKPEEAAEHWKKRHTDASRYIKKLQNQYGGITPEQAHNLLALQNVISRSPELMNQVQDLLEGKSNGSSEQKQVEYEQPPEDFNPQEMYDPTTPSGKWYQRQETARLDALKKDMLSGVAQMLQQRDQKLTQAQKMTARQRELQSFVTQRQLTPEEAADFQMFVSKGPGRPISLDDMYKFYQVVSNDEPGGNQEVTKSLNWDEIVEKGKKNVSPTKNPGAPQHDKQEDDFGKSLVESVRRRKITIE